MRKSGNGSRSLLRGSPVPRGVFRADTLWGRRREQRRVGLAPLGQADQRARKTLLAGGRGLLADVREAHLNFGSRFEEIPELDVTATCTLLPLRRLAPS